MMTNKDELRATLRSARKVVTEREDREARIASFLSQVLEGKRRIALYRAIAHETSLDSLLSDRSFCERHEIYLPKTLEDSLIFGLAGGEMMKGRFGITEPARAMTPASALDAIVLPALGVNRWGDRIGQGKAFYDRTLFNLPTRPLLIATVFSCQVIDREFAEGNDVPIDIIITENGVIDCREERKAQGAQRR